MLFTFILVQKCESSILTNYFGDFLRLQLPYGASSSMLGMMEPNMVDLLGEYRGRITGAAACGLTLPMVTNGGSAIVPPGNVSDLQTCNKLAHSSGVRWSAMVGQGRWVL